MLKKIGSTLIAALLVFTMPDSTCHAGAEIEGWGDFRGIRVDGELMRFATSIRALASDQKRIAFTATQMVKDPKWARDGKKQTSTGTILSEDGKSLSFRQAVEDVAPDSVKVDVEVTAEADFDLAGIYYFLNLPAADYAGGAAQFLAADAAEEHKASLDAGVTAQSVKMIRLTSPRRNIEVQFTNPSTVVIAKDRFIDTDIASQDGLRLPRDEQLDELIAMHFPIGTGNLAKGQSVHVSFTIKVSGTLDQQPVRISIDASSPGPEFDGIGGNFRVWSDVDLASAEYNLTNLRVPWGRVAMPLAAWQPTEETDPVAAVAGDDRGARDCRQSMEMAKILSDKQIPIIVTTWNMPTWSLQPPGPPLPGRPFAIPARVFVRKNRMPSMRRSFRTCST